MITNSSKPLTARFIGAGSETLLELMNATEQTLKCVEILTIFLKNLEPLSAGGASEAHIRFEAIKSIQPKGKAVVSHRTWINGKPAAVDNDQLQRLKILPGTVSPYVLDLSWQDSEGKTRFQRIPVGQ
jgi:hypothetical protein